MAKILFQIFPQLSHHNSTFGLANALKEKGHTVVYAAIKTLKDSIEYNGFLFYEIEKEDNVLIVGTPKKMRRGLSGVIQRNKEMLLFRRHCQNQIGKKEWFEKIINEIKPDLILIDGVYKLFSLQLVKYRIKYFFIETTVSTYMRQGIPPLSSSRIPKQNFSSQIYSYLEWRYYHLLPNIKSLFKRACIKYKYPLSEVDFSRFFLPGFKSIPEINTSPVDFDYPYNLLQNEYYFHNVYKLRVETSSDLNFRKIYESVLVNSENILCSFGTAGWRYPLQSKFFKTLMKVARTITNYNFVLCVDDDNLRRELRKVRQNNVLIFKRIPQLEFLKSTKIMINHGGLNSINECVLRGVPILICPGDRRLDQFGNAARIKYHGIGIQGSMDDSPKCISRNIYRLANDKSYKENLDSLLFKIQNNSSSSRTIDFIGRSIKEI